jgi:hypothetical protein
VDASRSGLGRLHHAAKVTSVPTIPSSTTAHGSSALIRTGGNDSCQRPP